MAYATTTQLNNEIAARKAGDANLQNAITALTARVAALEASRPAFGAYPQSAAQSFTGGHDIEVSKQTFSAIAYPAAALRFSGVVNVWVHDCDFDALGWDAIDIVGGCSGTLTIEDCRYRMLGTQSVAFYQQHGSRAGADFVQLDHSVMSGAIRRNEGWGGNTEDLISVQAGSGGPDAANPLIVSGNRFESPLPPDASAYQSQSGSCFMVEGGQHVSVTGNSYLNVAQGGLGFNGGTDIGITDNMVYLAKRLYANVGIYTLVPAPTDLTMARNRVWCVNAAGTPNPAYLAGGVQPSGWATNVLQDATLDPATMAVTL